MRSARTTGPPRCGSRCRSPRRTTIAVKKVDQELVVSAGLREAHDHPPTGPRPALALRGEAGGGIAPGRVQWGRLRWPSTPGPRTRSRTSTRRPVPRATGRAWPTRRSAATSRPCGPIWRRARRECVGWCPDLSARRRHPRQRHPGDARAVVLGPARAPPGRPHARRPLPRAEPAPGPRRRARAWRTSRSTDPVTPRAGVTDLT